MMPSIPDSEILVEFQAKYVQHKRDTQAALESAQNFSRELDARNVALKWHSGETLPSVEGIEKEQHEYEAQLAPLRGTLEKIDTYLRDVFKMSLQVFCFKSQLKWCSTAKTSLKGMKKNLKRHSLASRLGSTILKLTLSNVFVSG